MNKPQKNTKLLIIFVGVLATGFLAVSAYMSSLLVQEIGNKRQLKKDGITTTASIIEIDSRYQSGVKGSGSNKYYISYRFQTVNGETINRSDVQINRKDGMSAKVNDPVRIRYSASDPNINVVARGAERLSGNTVIFFTIMLLLPTCLAYVAVEAKLRPKKKSTQQPKNRLRRLIPAVVWLLVIGVSGYLYYTVIAAVGRALIN